MTLNSSLSSLPPFLSIPSTLNTSDAEELETNNIMSRNYYPTMKGGMLKPCEMSDKKVIDFVIHATII